MNERDVTTRPTLRDDEIYSDLAAFTPEYSGHTLRVLTTTHSLALSRPKRSLTLLDLPTYSMDDEKLNHMTSWLLLFLTVGCAYLTYDAFRWRKAVERAPFSSIANLWKGGLSHLSLAEQSDVQKRYSSFPFGAGEICWLFFALTIIFAVATVRAFLR